VKAIAVLFAVEWLARFLSLRLVEQLASTALHLSPMAVVVLYREEVSRVLAEIGRLPLLGATLVKGRPADTITEIVVAAESMALRRTGGTIAIERNVGLRAEADRGILVDALVTYDLLLSIFTADSPLHDGAVVIQNDRVAAARVFLPMSGNAALARRYGSRHLSAVGLTEGTDAVVVVVSEERGAISLAIDGRLMEYPKTALEAELRRLFSQHIRSAEQAETRRKRLEAARRAALEKGPRSGRGAGRDLPA
jgi:diadenylate cyclase